MAMCLPDSKRFPIESNFTLYFFCTEKQEFSSKLDAICYDVMVYMMIVKMSFKD